jgi:hypothetical protein
MAIFFKLEKINNITRFISPGGTGFIFTTLPRRAINEKLREAEGGRSPMARHAENLQYNFINYFLCSFPHI